MTQTLNPLHGFVVPPKARDENIPLVAIPEAKKLMRDILATLGYGKPQMMVELFIATVADAKAAYAETAYQQVRLRSVGAEDAILAEEGGALSDEQFAKALSVARSTVHNYREQKAIFAVPNGRRNLRYSSWQIHKKKLLPGLSEVLNALGDLDPFGTVQYFLTPAEALDDKRPLDLLRAGKTDEVIAQAHNHVDRR